MPRILKYIIYLIVFVLSFFVFLYWMFPYDILKDRVASAIEQPLGGAVEVSIGDISPYYFTGVEVSNMELISRANGEERPVADLQKVRVRASLFSLIFGNPHISFLIRAGKGEISGSGNQTDEGFNVDVDFDNFDVQTVKFLESQYGMKLSGRLSGVVELSVDRARPVRTSGKVDLSLDDFKIAQSQLNVGGASIPLPETAVTKGRDSRLKLTIDKGAVNVDELRFAGGDLGLDLKGKVFLSTVLANYRLNVTGSFRVSDKLGEAIPFLFMAEKQKQPDGSYPLSITGRASEPSIKVGTFTLPL